MGIIVEVVLPNGKAVNADLDSAQPVEKVLTDLIKESWLDQNRQYEIGVMLGSTVRPSGRVRVEEGARLFVIEKGTAPSRTRSGPHTAIQGDPYLQIYHLSDLHFPQTRMVDQKYSFGSIYDSQVGYRPTEVFERFLEREKERGVDVPKLLVVSGDLASKAKYDELVLAVQFISRTAYSLHPPVPEEGVIVVPGNHDVNWDIAQRSEYFPEKFDTFRSRLMDFDQPVLLPAFETAGGNPCRFLSDYGVLIYALNSCLLGGIVREDARQVRAVRSDLETMREILLNEYAHDAAIVQPVRKAIEGLRKLDEKSFIIDAGLVGKDFIHRISKDLRNLRDTLTSSEEIARFDDSLRIAVLHHHVSPFSPIETKEFEELLDVGPLKAALLQEGFHLVLHGHKHQPCVTRETVIDKDGEHSLVVVAAGSLGDWNSGSSFNIITLSNPIAREVEVRMDIIRMNHEKTRFYRDPLPAFVIEK